jgi:hypothetical protein
MSKVTSHNSVTDSDINHAETHLVTITVFLSSGMMSFKFIHPRCVLIHVLKIHGMMSVLKTLKLVHT